MKFKKIISVFVAILFAFTSLTACASLDLKMPSNKSNLASDNAGNGNDIVVNNMTVHYLDVGQGDCEFIEFPNGETMLIDAGESEYGARVCKIIKELGYNKIDYLVATHPHADHIGGLPAVFEEFEISSVYMPNGVSTSKAYEKLLDAVEKEDCTVIRAMAGVNVISGDKLNADFIAPVNDEYDELNNYSAVLKIKYNENSFLFMADAEKISESEITADVKADVIKVGHHGSKTASTEEFLSKVNPKYAVIEVGKDNSYGHPHSTTISHYKDLGTEILCTSELGDITAISDGKIIDIKGTK